MVLSLVTTVYAAGDVSPMVITTVDKTTVKPGETVTVTYTLAHDLDAMTRLTIILRFDASLFQFVSTNIDNSVWFDNPSVNNTTVSDGNNFVRLRQYKNSNTDTIAAGTLCTMTFKALEEISTAQSALFYNNNKGLLKSSIRVNGITQAVDGVGFASGVDDPISVNIIPAGSSITVPKTETGYSVSMGADQQVVSGQQVRIPVTVASSEKYITGFNAYDMTFTYDPTALTLNTKTGDAANLTVEDSDGNVRVRRYGATQALGEALALDFTAKAAATSTVTLTAAKFDIDANSINFDAPDAAISDADTVVNANNFTVTLPDAFTSDETRLVPNGGRFTFKPVDSRYTYTFTVKMGDTVTEGLTFGANDTYTIENISGNVEVTCTGKTPKQYDVEYVFGDKDPLLEKDVTKGPDKATYLQDYSVIVTPRAGLSYWIHYEIRYPNGTRSDQVSLTPVANADGTITYTIPGSKIDGTVYFLISTRTNDEARGYAVLVTGNGAEDQAPGNGTSVPRDMPYYLKLNERENCTYTVTAYYQPIDSITAVNMPAKVRSLGNGTYVVDPTPYTKLSGYAPTWRLVVNVEKVSQNAEEVSVSPYLELNDKTMMLITVKGTPEGGKAFTYDGNTMYKVNTYGADQYAWLVIVDKGQTLTQEEAAAKVAISAADNVVTITPSFDVNRTGKVDVNDAQLVYDMYNGTYRDFTQVSVEKFLRADVNATKVVDHTDAVAIVNQFN